MLPNGTTGHEATRPPQKRVEQRPNHGSAFRRSPLRTYLLIIALAVVPLALFLVGADWLIRYQITQSMLTQSAGTGQRVAKVIDDSLVRTTAFLRSLALRPDLLESARRGQASGIVQALHEVRQAHPDLSVIALYDGSGRLLAVSPAGADPLGARYTFTELRAGMAGNEPYVSPFFPAAGAQAMAIVVPLRAERGRPAGFIVGQQTLASVMRPLFAYSSPEASSLYFIVDQKQQVLGKHGETLAQVPTDPTVVQRLIQRAGSNAGMKTEIGGQEVIAAYAPVDARPWGVLISIPTAALRTALWKAERVLAIFGGIMLLLSLAVGGAVAALVERYRKRERGYQQQLAYRNQATELFEMNPAGTYVSDGERLVVCNPAFARMLGFSSAQEAAGTEMTSLYPSPEAHGAFLDELGRKGQLIARPKEFRRRDMSPVFVTENAIGTFEEGGRLVQVQGYLIDETVRRQAEEQLRQAQKMEAVGRLASGVAHDFNNILNVVSGYAELLADRLRLEEPHKKMFDEIQTAVRRAAGLTQQLLAFSRKQVLLPVVVDPNTVCREMERMLARTLGEDVELVTQLDPRVARVLIDRGQLEQVLLNLAVNARDAMPRGGRMVVATRMAELDEAYAQNYPAVTPGRYVEISVSDSGEGMSETTRQHLFEPFFTTKESGKGTGLGLATVYGIVKQSGGHINVYSELAHGTVFKVYLPPTDQPQGPAAAAVPVPVASGHETVLLVEDEAQLRNVSKMFLESRGYTVFEAAEAGEALRLLKDSAAAAQLLITDVVMPGMSGRELAEKAAASKPGIRVLFMSGYTDDAMLRHGLEHGEVPFIRKPFSLQELSAKIRELLAEA